MTSIKVPPLGESIVEATVARWLKNEGDAVAPGDTLVELETDKITVEVPSITGGVLKKRLVSEGDVVKLDQLLAEIDEKAAAPGPSDGKPKKAEPEKTEPRKAEAGKAEAGKAEARVAEPPPSPARVSPAAQRAAAESGADLSKIRGTGRGGVVSKADVVDAAAPPGKEPDRAERAEQTPPPPRLRLDAPSPRPASARRVRRCPHGASASPRICSSHSTRRRISPRSTRST